MSEKLKDFLNKLGKDPELLERFQKDPHGTMDDHGLEDKHKEMVLEGDKEKLQKETSAEDAHANFWIL